MSDLFGAPLPPKPYLQQLPATLGEVLTRGSRAPNGKGRIDPLTPDMQEVVAREALTCGITPSGKALEYTVMRLRAGLGVGQRPSPPAMPAHHLRFVDDRIDEILHRLGAQRKAAA